MSEELDDWAPLGVDGHYTAKRPWIDYAQNFTKGLQHLTGALAERSRRDEFADGEPAPDDGQLLPADGERDAILIEAGAFPSDRHAVARSCRFHGSTRRPR